MRVVVVGMLFELEYVTARSAVCHCASVAVAPEDDRLNTPFVSLDTAMFPIVAALGTKPSTSCPATKLPIVTVAVERVDRLGSVIEILESIAVGDDPAR